MNRAKNAGASSDGVAIARIPLSERDRRYRLVRRRMAKDGIDVLILPANHTRWDQMMADSRYLTTIGGFGTETLTVFPAEGDVTAGVFNRAGWWKRAQGWVTDVRDCRNAWGSLIVERLNELRFPARGRIGIVGLSRLLRAPDGLIPYSTVKQVRQAFPEAHIVDATDLMTEARAVKSAAEITLMRRSVEIIEAMIDAMANRARPGVTEKQLYATMVSTMLENDGELPSLLIFGSGPGIASGQFVPTNRVLQQGDIIVGETEAHFCGYSGQAVQPVSLGKQPDGYMALMNVAMACFEGLRERMQPGTTMGELMDAYERIIEREGKGKLEFSHPTMHARGLGDERPAQFGKQGLETFRQIPLEAGMTFVVKPRAISGRIGRTAQIGDTVVVAKGGGKRLGKRTLGLRVV